MFTEKIKGFRKGSYICLTLLSTVCPSATNAESLAIEKSIDWPVIGGMLPVPRQKGSIADELEPQVELLYERYEKEGDNVLKDLRSPPIDKGEDLLSSQDSKKYVTKLGVMDLSFDPQSDTRKVLSKSTEEPYLGKNPSLVSYYAHSEEGGEDHANHVASIVHQRAPRAVLRVIDLYNEPSTKGLAAINARLVAGIDAAIKSKVDFLNISLRVSPGNGEMSKDYLISQEVVQALYRARDAGIGIIKSAGNDNEMIGFTSYTASLVRLLENMHGSMILVGATGLDENGQENLARFSNKAGQAHQYTVSAPGVDILACGASNVPIRMSGTSMAAPFVTAMAGCLKEAYPDLSAKDILEAIRLSARKVSLDQQTYFAEVKYGCGLVDLQSALIKAGEIYNLQHL